MFSNTKLGGRSDQGSTPLIHSSVSPSDRFGPQDELNAALHEKPSGKTCGLRLRGRHSLAPPMPENPGRIISKFKSMASEKGSDPKKTEVCQRQDELSSSSLSFCSLSKILPFPQRTSGAPRNDAIQRFRDDHRRHEQYMKAKILSTLKLNMFFDIDEAMSVAGSILTYIYQINKETGASLDEIFKKIEDVARSPNFMEYFGAATVASGDASYYISLVTNAVIAPMTLLPAKAGVAGVHDAYKKYSEIRSERIGCEKQNQMLNAVTRDIGEKSKNVPYLDRLVRLNDRKLEELDFRTRQNTYGLQFACSTIASALLIVAKSGVSYGFQKHTMEHRSPRDLDAANIAGLATGIFAALSVLSLAMMATSMDAKNRHAVQGIRDRRAILDKDGRDDDMARFAAEHLDGGEAYLLPDLERGDMSRGRYLLAQGADALKVRFKNDFGKENHQLKISSFSLLAFSALNLAAGFGSKMEMPIFSNAAVLQGCFWLGSINAVYASVKSLSCYVYGHHGQQDREEWLAGDFPLLDRASHMLMDATGHDGTELRDRIRGNIEADAGLRDDFRESTDHRFWSRAELKAGLRDQLKLAENLGWLAKFMDNRIPVLQATHEQRREVLSHMNGSRGLPSETDRIPWPRRELMESSRNRMTSSVEEAGEMLKRAREVRDYMRGASRIEGLGRLGVQAIAHEFMRVYNHEPQSEPPLFMSDTLEELTRLMDPHEVGHAEEDKRGILAETHISARAVAPPRLKSAMRRPSPPDSPLPNVARPVSPTQRNSLIEATT